jgi:hypothetical protein
MSDASIVRGRFVRVISFALVILLVGAGSSAAVDVGQVAPDFNLESTTGGKVSLSQFRGKHAVLIEFYGAAFAPV